MRAILTAAAAAMLFAGVAFAQEGLFQRDHGKVAPPAAASAGAAPPEGTGPGGFDFGRWRGASVDGYAESLQAKFRARLAGKSLAVSRADLESNGFSCMEPRDRPGAARVPALECRLSASEQSCTHEWWTVIEEPGEAPKAGYDRMCGRR